MEKRDRKVILTIDYEVFGNGTGDVKKHVIEPAEKLMRLGEQFRVPVTFFVQVEELCAYERFGNNLFKDLGYRPADLIRKQIQEMVNRGHDVQLHIHPQWFNAQYVKSHWMLHDEMTNVDSLYRTKDDTVRYIREKKSILDDIISKDDAGRSVCAFRAGAFCAQPGRYLIDALIKNGIQFESSVVKGMHRTEGQGALDYRTTPCKGAWKVGNDVTEENVNGTLIEVPIASKIQWRFQQMTLGRMKAKFSRDVPKEKQAETLKGFGISKNPMSIVKFLFNRFPTKYDLHNVNGKSLAKWISKHPSVPGSPLGQDVIVVIGHTKEHRDDKNVELFLSSLLKTGNCTVTDFNSLQDTLSSKSK